MVRPFIFLKRANDRFLKRTPHVFKIKHGKCFIVMCRVFHLRSRFIHLAVLDKSVILLESFLFNVQVTLCIVIEHGIQLCFPWLKTCLKWTRLRVLDMVWYDFMIHRNRQAKQVPAEETSLYTLEMIWKDGDLIYEVELKISWTWHMMITVNKCINLVNPCQSVKFSQVSLPEME